VVVTFLKPLLWVMGPGFRDDDGGWESTITRIEGNSSEPWIPPRSNFPHIEITRISPLNVSSRGLGRNNSLAHETIFWFWRRHPETVVA
jgi:hypothetical protein